MNIIGLGNTGCNIAKEFENYPQYNVYYIDSEPRSGKNSYLMPNMTTQRNMRQIALI